MTDTPVTTNPPSSSDRVKAFIGDLARPLAIIMTSGAASIATVMVAYRTENGNDAAILMGAVYAGVSALYIGKAWENTRTGRQAADVEIAKATGESK